MISELEGKLASYGFSKSSRHKLHKPLIISVVTCFALASCKWASSIRKAR